MNTVRFLGCTLVEETTPINYEWRRIQTHEQQAERQKKNLLQKALIFGNRADQLRLEDPS